MTRYSICVKTGIDQGTLCRFVKGQCGMSLVSIDRLMEFLGLEIRPRRGKRKDG
jgi:hypothetical protein